MQALLEALAITNLPDVQWSHGDDLCDCTFQQIATVANPYIGKTMMVRLCCVWEAIYAEHPEYVQRVDAFWDDNSKGYVHDIEDWNSTEMDMPRALWHRQIAARTGQSLADIRVEYAEKDPPKRIIKSAFPEGI